MRRYREEYGLSGSPIADNCCRRCGLSADQCDVISLKCSFCGGGTPSGQVAYVCFECENRWVCGSKRFERDMPIVCDSCKCVHVGDCVECHVPVLGSNARFPAGLVVCGTCFDKAETIWCPKCERNVVYGGYLRFAFRDNPAGSWAAALVTHYRHDHVRSYDRACSSHHYRSRIPGFNFFEQKEQINNRAKRQLIRAVVTHVESGTLPAHFPFDPQAFIAAFGDLLSSDEKTKACIARAMQKLKKIDEKRKKSH